MHTCFVDSPEIYLEGKYIFRILNDYMISYLLYLCKRFNFLNLETNIKQNVQFQNVSVFIPTDIPFCSM